MQIIKGKLPGRRRLLCMAGGYWQVNFCSKVPDPVFIDTEGSTKDMDVANFLT